MPGGVEELILRVIGDSASGEQALDRIDKRLAPLKSRLDQVSEAGKRLGIVFGALSAAGGKLIQSTAKIAMRNEVLALSLYTVGENAGYSREQMDALTDQVKGLGITTSQARLSLTRMIQGQLDLAKATDLARTAQNLAVIAGENSSQTYGDLAQAITSLQPRLLRKYGIVTTLNQALGDLANSTDVAAKRNRMLEFVLAEGAKTAGVYEEAMGVVGKRITSIPRLVEEAQAAFGKHFLPIIGKVVDLLSNLLKWFEKLPEGVQHVLAMAVLLGTGFSAVAAALAGLLVALPFIISGFSAVSGAIAPILPALAPIAAVIAALVAAGALLSRAWRQNWGGIRTAIEEAWQKIGPILRFLAAYLGGWARELGQELRALGATLWQLLRGVFEPVFSRIAQVIQSIDWLSIYRTLRDALNVAGNTIKAFLETLRRLLRGEGFRAFSSLEDAAIDGLTLVALVFDKHIKKALVWGWNLIVQVANGISRAAQSILVRVMQFVGNIIGRFLAPGSPPKEGPLASIVKWGRGVMTTFLQAFKLADFSVLRDSLAPIRDALQNAVAAGDLDEEGFVGLFGRVREQVAGLIAEFRKTGEISEEALGRISESLGAGSEDLVKYLRLQLQHRKALDDLAKVQEEVAAAEAKGFVSAELKDKLAAAEDAASAAEDELNWQKEYLAVQQESVDLQMRLVNALDKLSRTMDKLTGAGGGEGIGGEEGLFGDIGDSDEVSSGLSLIRAKLGEMSPEFAEMRKKVEGWYAAFKAWLELPFVEKMRDLAQRLEEVTGIDFPGFLETVIDAVQKIEEEGLLAVVSEWIGAGIEYVDENWEGWADTIAGFLMNMFIQAVANLMDIIELAKTAITGWFGTIVQKLVAWIEEKKEEWGQTLKEKFILAWNSFIAKITASINTYATQLKTWMRAVVISFVAKVLEKIAEWVDGLKAVGKTIVDKIKSGISSAWNLVGYIGGFLRSLPAQIIENATDFLDGLKEVGKAIVKKIREGIKEYWYIVVNVIIKLLRDLRGLLPESEPKDPRSPLRNLAASGRAFVTNWAAGINFDPVLGALSGELARTQRLMAGAGAAGGVSLTQQFGDVVFPNVRDGRDALSVRRGLQQQALEASMVGRTRVGG